VVHVLPKLLKKQYVNLRSLGSLINRNYPHKKTQTIHIIKSDLVMNTLFLWENSLVPLKMRRNFASLSHAFRKKKSKKKITSRRIIQDIMESVAFACFNPGKLVGIQSASRPDRIYSAN
jgi:hypothetical protein